MNILAILLGVLALCAIPGTLLMAGLLLNLGEVPTEYQSEVLWQSVGVISGFTLLLSLSLWLLKRATSMSRARKAA